MKIALVGTSPSAGEAPFADPGWEIWSLAGSGGAALPRWDRWFELHDLEKIERDFGVLWAWLVGQDGSRRVYLRGMDPRVPGSIPFPRDAMLARFGSHFFSCSAAWMLALAISEGAEEIGLWGIDMQASSEYEYQRPGCQHFLALAKALGIKVTLPPGCQLLSSNPIYQLGEGAWRREQMELQLSRINAGLAEGLKEVQEIQQTLLGLTGARDAIQHALRNWV